MDTATVLSKDDLERREEAWAYKAEREGYTCAVCSNVPPYGEREVYFETGLCGWCAHTRDKDD